MRPTTSLHACLAAFLAGSLLMATQAAAVTDTAFKYSTDKVGQYSISPMDLAPDNQYAAARYSISWSPTKLTVEDPACANTGLHLPSGAKITSLRFWYKATSAEPMTVKIFSTALASDDVDTIAFAEAAEATAERKGVVFNLPQPVVVSNTTRAYGLGLCLYPNQQFLGARITYTYDNAGD